MFVEGLGNALFVDRSDQEQVDLHGHYVIDTPDHDFAVRIQRQLRNRKAKSGNMGKAWREMAALRTVITV